MSTVPEPLATLLRKYWNINVAAYAADLGRSIRGGRIDIKKATSFRQQLVSAIHSHVVSPSDYNRLTEDNEFTSREQVQEALKEFWEAVFPGEPIDS
jgi:hypothetical protein